MSTLHVNENLAIEYKKTIMTVVTLLSVYIVWGSTYCTTVFKMIVILL